VKAPAHSSRSSSFWLTDGCNLPPSR